MDRPWEAASDGEPTLTAAANAPASLPPPPPHVLALMAPRLAAAAADLPEEW